MDAADGGLLSSTLILISGFLISVLIQRSVLILIFVDSYIGLIRVFVTLNVSDHLHQIDSGTLLTNLTTVKL